jgi:hypothetical protein
MFKQFDRCNALHFQEKTGEKITWEETLRLRLENIFTEKRGGGVYPKLPSKLSL